MVDQLLKIFKLDAIPLKHYPKRIFNLDPHICPVLTLQFGPFTGHEKLWQKKCGDSSLNFSLIHPKATFKKKLMKHLFFLIILQQIFE